ncbi:MAG: D-tyrosyl-tRNA(Tyr) deacylase [Nitrospirae bacterium]|nr:D-tyrosyl-tRNA(Tyr) deacylase [Nitrospirota bacterium]
MRVLVQRVKQARVIVDMNSVSGIKAGLVLFVGVGKDDSSEDIERMVNKVLNLRIFEDNAGKMNLNIIQARGQVLSVPQFTLYADTSRGNRPGFERSARPETAKEHWNKFNSMLEQRGMDVKEGIFGAHMEVELINDGPVTIWLDTDEI